MSALVDHWDESAGDWEPDEWDRRVEAVIAERDRVADSISGPVPVYGSPEWIDADAHTKAVAQARFERDTAAARGRAISDRMARELAERADRIDAEKLVGAGLARMESLPRKLVERREQEREWRKTQPRPSDLIPARRAGAACRELTARAEVRMPRQRADDTDPELAAAFAVAEAACRVREGRGDAREPDDDTEDDPRWSSHARDDELVDVDER